MSINLSGIMALSLLNQQNSLNLKCQNLCIYINYIILNQTQFSSQSSSYLLSKSIIDFKQSSSFKEQEKNKITNKAHINISPRKMAIDLITLLSQNIIPQADNRILSNIRKKTFTKHPHHTKPRKTDQLRILEKIMDIFTYQQMLIRQNG
ncbi:unnamed protein product [Paramecium primaurelia]|uniref:Uncharacterized protein n=1 Tax=Paramecium primaurelia TaxID=5886 RepID=A0A8S1QK42_PARPR|nr:unnamed protein product [Paramecium primaurelia]